MTDRIQHFTVYLDQPIREDDLAAIETTLKMVKHVSRVERGTPINHEFHQYAATKGIELYQEFEAFLYEKLLGRKRTRD